MATETKVWADNSGSREPDPSSTGSGPSGFDPGRSDFTIADVLEWARTKPADERYVFIKPANCALGQFAREMRGFSEAEAECQLYRELVSVELFAAAQGGGCKSIAELEAQQTFGCLVSRLEKLCPEAPVTRSDWLRIDAYLSDIELAREGQSA